jgi:Fe-S-cluster containining protein
MSDLNFNCTQCGKCCHDLRLPLTCKEAVAWLKQGGSVEVLCEAIPWVTEPSGSDAEAMRKRLRSFSAKSGELPIRVIVLLTASFKGACPHLQSDMRCGNYNNRPHVCRIYPAEANPFRSLTPSHKKCPSEAWSSPQPFLRAGKVVDAQTQLHITLLEHESQLDVAFREWVCEELAIRSAGLSNEGFVVHRPSSATLLSVLQQSAPTLSNEPRARSWELTTNQASTLDALLLVGAKSVYTKSSEEGTPHYLGFRPDTSSQVVPS